ncbi:MAG TPA: secretin and TonB N-terminal domain-containing protein [Thermoanaerobaculia bacterium]|jgi:TPR repeat protein|nr:secretin and TonB N-terminal domain-containing protein [Thermoanaerobaculia bacterium]
MTRSKVFRGLAPLAFAFVLSLPAAPPTVAQEKTPKTLAELRAAAKSGEPQALLDLADELAFGAGSTPEREAEAALWYRRAAEKGSADGQHYLGLLLWGGQGVEKNQAEAVQWFRRAADQGQKSSQYWLASAYEFGQGGLDLDAAEAAKWYRRAADQGQPEAQSSLGEMYAAGSGVPQDDAEAVRWFRKAADQHSPSGEHSLGEMYAAGRGVPKDEKEAARLFGNAAEKDYTVSMTALGEAYEQGRGIEKNPVCAYFWYGFAAKRGFSIGEEKLDVLAAKLSTAQRAEGERMVAAADVLDGVVQHPACPGDLMTIHVTNAALGEVLRTFETMSGLKILGIDEKVADLSVTLQLEDVPWETALTQALTGTSYTWKREGEGIRIVPKPKTR